MRLSFTEIRSATQVIPQLFKQYKTDLWVGSYCFDKFSPSMLKQFLSPESCDEELIDALFSARELFWQPNMQPSLTTWITRFSMLRVFVKSYIEALKVHDTPIDYLYAGILHDMVLQIEATQEALTSSTTSDLEQLFQSVMKFRLSVYPHIIFFTKHPYMPESVLKYAQNRLHIMIHTLFLKGGYAFRLFQDPYWQIRPVSKQSSDRTERKDASSAPQAESSTSQIDS